MVDPDVLIFCWDPLEPQQGLDVRVVRLRLERVPEEDQKVYLTLDDLGADLLVAAEGAALEPLDRELQLLLESRPGRAGCEYCFVREPGDG